MVPNNLADNLSRMESITKRWENIFSMADKVDNFYVQVSGISEAGAEPPSFPLTEADEKILPGSPSRKYSLKGICRLCRLGEQKYTEHKGTDEEKMRYRLILNKYLYSFRSSLMNYKTSKEDQYRWATQEQIPYLKDQMSLRKNLKEGTLTYKPFTSLS